MDLLTTWTLIGQLLNPQLVPAAGPLDVCAEDGHVVLTGTYAGAEIITSGQPEITWVHPDAYMVWYAQDMGACFGNDPPGFLVIFGPLGGSMPAGEAVTLAAEVDLFYEWEECEWPHYDHFHHLTTGAYPLGGGENLVNEICPTKEMADVQAETRDVF